MIGDLFTVDDKGGLTRLTNINEKLFSEITLTEPDEMTYKSFDGMLKGINWDATIALAEAISIPVVASGGLASIEDIRRMIRPDARRLEGAIAGRALYDGRLDPAEALRLVRSARAA